MDVRQLRYFLGIVEHGSVAKAAKALHVAQSAISLHLRHLEAELGCQLVHRTPRGVVPTESGRRLAQRAESIVKAMSTLADEVRGVETPPAGPVTVGIPTSLATVLTVPLALEIRSRYPLIRLRVIEGLSGHMAQWLSSGQVDLALVFGAEAATGTTKELVGRERLNLVGPRDGLLSGRAAIPAGEVFGLPLILPGRPHGLREEVERAALVQRVPLNIVLEVDSLEHIKALVAEGVGYTVLSQRVAESGATARSLEYRPIVAPEIERVIFLAHSSARPLSHAAAVVKTLVLEKLGPRLRAS